MHYQRRRVDVVGGEQLGRINSLEPFQRKEFLLFLLIYVAEIVGDIEEDVFKIGIEEQGAVVKDEQIVGRKAADNESAVVEGIYRAQQRQEHLLCRLGRDGAVFRKVSHKRLALDVLTDDIGGVVLLKGLVHGADVLGKMQLGKELSLLHKAVHILVELFFLYDRNARVADIP